MSPRMVALAALLAGCAGPADRRTPAASDTATGDQPPPDSLVLTAPGGVEVWYTHARTGVSPEGAPCVDRTLEIRRGESRLPVPLLYTGSAPELVNDSTIRARLSSQCAPGDAYLVNLRTGQPVRER